jgi:anti-sigma factor RsiW
MRNAHVLTCAEIVELVTDYLDDALDPVERRRFQAHVAGCEECTIYVEQIRLTVELAGRLRVGDLDEQTRAGLLRAFGGWRTGGG